jgi:hypothetical protein
MLARRFGKNDASAGTDDAVPGNVHRLWGDSQCESGLSRSARETGGACDGAVGRRLAARD